MGTDKAAIQVPTARGEPLTLAERTARLLTAATEVALEVGPGYSSLDRVDDSPGLGPLVATVSGASELRARGWAGAVLVVATDLPHLSAGMLTWLSGYEPGRSILPIIEGRAQPLCARYEPGDLDLAARLVGAGKRAMYELIDAADPILVPEDVWVPHAGDRDCLVDADTPDELDSTMGRRT